MRTPIAPRFKGSDFFNAKFFNKETAEYGNNTVTANILSLRLGLVPEGYEETFAEMGEEEKNKISHRARAVKKLSDFFNTL